MPCHPKKKKKKNMLDRLHILWIYGILTDEASIQCTDTNVRCVVVVVLPNKEMLHFIDAFTFQSNFSSIPATSTKLSFGSDCDPIVGFHGISKIWRKNQETITMLGHLF